MACTSSLGSIAFGSFLLAVMDIVSFFVQKAFDSLPEEVKDSCVVRLLRGCVTCCLGFVKSVMEWLEEYAFVFIAIYGMGFVEAGREVRLLMRRSGLGAIAQTTLLSGVFTLGKALGVLVGAAAGAGVAFALAAPLLFTLLAGAATGLVASSVGLTVIDSGAKTIFVCYFEAPDLLPSDLAGLSDGLKVATDRDTSKLIAL